MACYGAGSASAAISLPNGTVDIDGNSSLYCCDCGGGGGGGGGGGAVLNCSDPTACNYNSSEACIFGNPCGTTFQVRAAMAGVPLDVFGNMQWCGTINVSVGGAELISDNDNPSALSINRIYKTYVSTPVSVSFIPVACGTNITTQTFCCGNNPDGSASLTCPQGGSAFIEVLEGCAAQPAGCFASVGQWDCRDTVRGDCESEHNRGISYTITPCLEIDCNC